VLWPYFHYVVQDDPQNMMSQDGPYKAYKELNQQFADTIVANHKEGDISKKHYVNSIQPSYSRLSSSLDKRLSFNVIAWHDSC
jgi:hypothetical protein